MGRKSRAVSAISRHLEVELKFDVVDSTPGPSFDGVADIADVQREPVQRLSAVYYDTPGQDLRAQRITLRRRTGGTDAGWHLKLPAGIVARTEIHADLGEDPDNDVPVALRDVVAAVVRDRPLAPVARITNHRRVDVLFGRDGTALAEFCDDHVTAVTEGSDTEQRWREWELELAEDAVERGIADTRLLKRLSKRLRAAGAVPVPAHRASKLARTLGPATPAPRALAGSEDPVRRRLAQEIESMLAWDRAVRADAQDSVHQMRVTIRTIRSLLQSSPRAFGISKDAQILDELSELASVLGTARDAEVLAERYRRVLDELPLELVRGPVRARLIDGCHELYRIGLRKSLTAMRTERYFRLLDGLDSLLVADAARSAATKKAAKSTIKTTYARVLKRVKRAENADSADHDATLHAVRKSAKRLRYNADASGRQKIAHAAKTLQTVLGDHRDNAVSRSHLIAQADLAHAAGEDTFTYGLLHERESQLARDSERQLAAALKSLRQAVNRAH